MKSTRLVVRLIRVMAAIACALSLVLLSGPASAKLTVTGVILVADVDPGESITHRMTVDVGDSEMAEIYAVIGGLGQNSDGAYFLTEPDTTGQVYSAAQFVVLDRTSISAKAGEPAQLTATLTLPQSIGEGGRYALINVSTGSSGGSTVNVRNAINVPILVTVRGSNLVHTGQIQSVMVSEATPEKPIVIETCLENTGNHHYKVSNEVTILDPAAKVLDVIHLDHTGNSILPSATRVLKAKFIPERVLEPGTYAARSKVTGGDGTVLDERMTSFKIGLGYAPPPAPAETLLTPSNPGVLEPVPGRVKVTFPAGAVLADTRVALRPCDRDQVPKPPNGYAAGGTSFRLEGVGGLLAKPCRISVGYDSQELMSAAGQVSSLALARWDESLGRWSVARTKVDPVSRTLSAETDKLGIWSTMVREAPQSSLPWRQFALVALIALLCIGVVLVTSKKRLSR